jgi:hypothetical protein
MSETTKEKQPVNVIYASQWRDMTIREIIESIYIALNVLQEQWKYLTEKDIIDLTTIIEIISLIMQQRLLSKNVR